MITRKIPTTIITGFLGAGKTTLIRHMLENANGRRIALIINEFGDVGVDGEVLKGCGDALCKEEDVIELANGCICCTVADDFVPTMTKLLDRAKPHRPHRHRNLRPRPAPAAGSRLQLAGNCSPCHRRWRGDGR